MPKSSSSGRSGRSNSENRGRNQGSKSDRGMASAGKNTRERVVKKDTESSRDSSGRSSSSGSNRDREE